MAYRPRPYGLVRDKAYPSEIAAQRPALATRIHCEAETSSLSPDSPDHSEFEGEESPSKSVRGDKSRDMCDWFNRALRSGHGFRNDGDE
jgi:hypothetical protein